MRNIAIIPAYEPAEGMLEFLEKLKAENFAIVLVDDGSGRGYAEIFRRAKRFVTVLYHDKNYGKGTTNSLINGYFYLFVLLMIASFIFFRYNNVNNKD